MSTLTPIEIVREYQRWRRAQGQYAGLCQCPHTPEEIGLALDSVLSDAERFQALERAQWLRVQVGRDDRSFVSRRPGSSNEFSCESLGELADYLRRLGCDKRPAGK